MKNEEIVLNPVVQEYVVYVNDDAGQKTFKVMARIIKSAKQDNPIPYTFEVNYRTSMGGGSGIYYKDFHRATIEEITNDLKYYLSLFNMAGRKVEANTSY